MHHELSNGPISASARPQQTSCVIVPPWSSPQSAASQMEWDVVASPAPPMNDSAETLLADVSASAGGEAGNQYKTRA